ncbi:vWA domain-containing protein [Sporosarcina cyprini]|uniref:vWA domain-containing protein n=1 Tax=Sporosarcina cyprini TaxID=2910523 RepID=UPI001EE10FCA|nr:VWA domain-containing protein [Sporosarcina cyprini]MCG3087892.1 VWA domain-containing protein [Sporosarcina cyprini]
MREWIIRLLAFSAIAILLSGCSEKGKPEPDVTEASDEVKLDTEQSKEAEEETPAPSVLDEIKEIQIPVSEETFRAQKPGIFTADIPHEEETKQKWGRFGLGDYKEELTEKLSEVTAETQDPELLFKALHYYVGSNAYDKVATDLEEFNVDWFEPYLPEPGEVEGAQEAEQQPGKAIILLDASSSMLLSVEGKQKMAIAKRATSRFASTIGMRDDVSLVVYGHAGTQNQSDKELSCTTIEEVYPMSAFDAAKFKDAVDGVEAKGWTPIAEAIKFAREQSEGSTENLTVYIVSDGAETCGGDPVAEAKAFAEANDGRKVNIIGFDVDQQGEQQLKAVAEAGKGEYISAKTIDELDQSITKQWLPSLQDIMGKSNSLLKHWGQGYDEMVNRSAIASQFWYASLNESSRMFEALQVMRSEKMITAEVYDQIKEMINAKEAAAIEVKKELNERARIRVENERQEIINRVNDWTDRMFELRKTQGK